MLEVAGWTAASRPRTRSCTSARMTRCGHKASVISSEHGSERPDTPAGKQAPLRGVIDVKPPSFGNVARIETITLVRLPNSHIYLPNEPIDPATDTGAQ